MTYTELKKDLDPAFKGATKAEFIDWMFTIEPRTRVGGPKGKGRLTAKRALALLGVK
jgi:hypothetical protein